MPIGKNFNSENSAIKKTPKGRHYGKNQYEIIELAARWKRSACLETHMSKLSNELIS